MFKRFELDENTTPIISDSAIATHNWGDGRFIPSLVLDCSINKGLSDLIQIHKDTPPGDVKSYWAVKLINKKYAYLILEVKMPMELTVVIPFELETKALLVDAIINSNAVYLQVFNILTLNTLEEKYNGDKILIEIPSSTTFPSWEKLFLKTMTNKFYVKSKNKSESKRTAKKFISESRKLWQNRNIVYQIRGDEQVTHRLLKCFKLSF
jgi:hypothetical protein